MGSPWKYYIWERLKADLKKSKIPDKVISSIYCDGDYFIAFQTTRELENSTIWQDLLKAAIFLEKTHLLSTYMTCFN